MRMCAHRQRTDPPPRLMPGGRPTADASVRLVRAEAALTQQAQALEVATKQLDKLHTRLRVGAGDIKTPLKQLQQAAAGHAEAIGRLGEAHARLAKQVEGVEEVIGALQAVAARQFQVRRLGQGAPGVCAVKGE